MRAIKDTLRKGGKGEVKGGRLINRRPSFSQDVYAREGEGKKEGGGGHCDLWMKTKWVEEAGEKDLVRGPVEIKLANGAIFYGGPLKS